MALGSNLLYFYFRTLEFRVDQLQRSVNDEAVLAKIHTGKIRGSKRLTIYDKIYYSFERIPYALPPLGELRFRAPRPMVAWKQIQDCSCNGPKALQRNPMDPKSIEGSEDCLHLNVYTNNLKPSAPRPIMVWIHGGGYQFGEANREWYGPDYFMQKDVILVTVQYRLGALGFLSLRDPGLHAPGNAGLKDIVLALKWVKRNAVAFGGNPECVTLFGESAGAAAVNFLMLSEHARGLFQRAILQSGVATSDWATSDCGSRAFELAKAAGYDGENKENRILKYLMQLPAAQILEAESKCLQRNPGELFLFAPTIEPYFSAHTVLAKPVEELMRHAWSNGIPLIVGANSLEGIFFKRAAVKNEAAILKCLETCSKYVPRSAVSHFDSPECEEKGLRLRKIHVKGEQPTLDDYYEIVTYLFYWHPIHKVLESRLKHAYKSPTFLYRFDFKSDKFINPFRQMRNGDDGVAHTDELSYLFSGVMAKPLERQSREFICLKRMITMWTQFAETGNPNGPKVPQPPGRWRSLRRGKKGKKGCEPLQCLNIGDDLRFGPLPEMAKLQVWQGLYEMHRKLPESTKPLDVVSGYAKSSL